MAIYKAIQAFAVDDEGNVLPSASVEIRRESDNGLPTLYDGPDTSSDSPIGNPFTADSEGFYIAYAPNGKYKVTVSFGAFTATYRNVEHYHLDQGTASSDSPTFDQITVNQITAAGAVQLDAALNVDGSMSATNGITVTGSIAAIPAGSTIDGVLIASQDYVDAAVAGIDEWQDSVLDELNTPPGSPTEGDRYIVGTSPTGAWSSNADDIAEWISGAWVFTTAVKGMATLRESDDRFMIYNGSAWVFFGSVVNHNALTSLQGGGSSERYHLTAAQHTSVGNIVSAGYAENLNQNLRTSDSPTFNAPTLTSISVSDQTKNAQGTKTISTSAPSGGSNGDVWYQV